MGTTFFAALLGALGRLKDDLESIKAFYAWNNREVSMSLINELEADGDGKINEYEFRAR